MADERIKRITREQGVYCREDEYVRRYLERVNDGVRIGGIFSDMRSDHGR